MYIEIQDTRAAMITLIIIKINTIRHSSVLTGLKFEAIRNVDYQQNSREKDGGKVFVKTASHYSICCLLISLTVKVLTKRTRPTTRAGGRQKTWSLSTIRTS